MSPRIPIKYKSRDHETEREPEREAPAESLPEEVNPASPAAAAEPVPDAPPPTEDWQDRYTRLMADFANFRRHAEAERTRLLGLGRESALMDIFPLLDHLERGLAWAREHGAAAAVIKGLLLVQKEFEKVLDKHGVKRMPTLGETFNPELHEAVSAIARDGVEPGKIVEEVAAGFTREGKVLRPARVVVAA
jgi:molecular chaperone GrpE